MDAWWTLIVAKIWPGVKKYNCRSVSDMCSFNLVFDNHSHRGQLLEYLFQKLLSDCVCIYNLGLYYHNVWEAITVGNYISQMKMDC
jgi:hypothetical protein